MSAVCSSDLRSAPRSSRPRRRRADPAVRRPRPACRAATDRRAAPRTRKTHPYPRAESGELRIADCALRRCSGRPERQSRDGLWIPQRTQRIAVDSRRLYAKGFLRRRVPQFIYTMKGLSKVHQPDTKVLEDIWLSFYFGAKIGVLGLNGAGKSSRLRIMAGEDQQFTGKSSLLRIM